MDITIWLVVQWPPWKRTSIGFADDGILPRAKLILWNLFKWPLSSEKSSPTTITPEFQCFPSNSNDIPGTYLQIIYFHDDRDHGGALHRAPKRSLQRPWLSHDVFVKYIRNKHRKPDSIRGRRGWWQRGWILLVGHSVAKQGTVDICFEFLVEYCECRRNWVRDNPPKTKK